MDEKIKQELIEFMIVSGKRLLKEQGTLPDIGVKKQYLKIGRASCRERV